MCRISFLSRRTGLVPRGLLCAAAFVFATFGCESPTEADSHALLTEWTSFWLAKVRLSQGEGHAVRIPYTFTNRTGSAVFLSNCLGGFARSLEMQRAGEWVAAWHSAQCLGKSPDIVIEPDEVYSNIVVAAGTPDELIPPPDESTPYRIKWLAGHFSTGEHLPLEERVSNSFTLKLPR